MPYWKLYYHLVWATHEREYWLTPKVEPVVHGFIRSKAVGLGGTVYAVNGIEDHVHVVVAIPPRISVARFTGQLKGVSSSRLNKSGLLDHTFAWQGEYGAVSFDAKRLPNYIAYVEAQKEHHGRGTTIPALERTREPADVIAEPPGIYFFESEAWRREFDED